MNAKELSEMLETDVMPDVEVFIEDVDLDESIAFRWSVSGVLPDGTLRRGEIVSSWDPFEED